MILGWPGYRVYRSEIDEEDKTLRLWVRRKRGKRKLECSGCGRRVNEIAETYEREVRDLPWSEYSTTVVIELYRVGCPDCGIKAEKVPPLPSKAPFSKRFEEAVGQACESAAVRRVARQFGLVASTVRAIDLRYLRRWWEGRRRPALRQMGVDEIYLGKKTEVSDGGDEPGDGRATVVRPRAEERNAGRVFREASECVSTKCDSSGHRRWTKCGGHSSSAKEEPRGIWYEASAGCF